MKQSRPRTSSSTFTINSPSGNSSVRPRPSGICRYSQIFCASWGFARPVKSFSLSASDCKRGSAPSRDQWNAVARHVAGDRRAFGDDRIARHASKWADRTLGADVGTAADERERADDGVGADGHAGLDVDVVAVHDGHAAVAELAV